MSADTKSSGLRLRWWPRPWVLLSFFLICVLIACAAFWFGRALRPATDKALDRAAAVVPVSAAIVERTPAPVQVSGTVVRPAIYTVKSFTPEVVDNGVSSDDSAAAGSYGSGGNSSEDEALGSSVVRTVVTRAPKHIDDSVPSGSVLAELNDVPVFGLKMRIPLYRDLSIGDKGADVRRLEQSLKSIGLFHNKPEGRYTEATASSIRLLFERNGYTAPLKGRSVRASELVALPFVNGIVTQRKRVGSVVKDGSALLTLSSGAWVAKARVDVLQSNKFKAGKKVTVRPIAGSRTWSGNVQTVSGFRAAQGAKFAGYDVTVEFNLPSGVSLKQGEKMTLSSSVNDSKQLAVPLSAVREGTSGTYLLAVSLNGASRRVPVDVLGSDSGWAFVSSTNSETSLLKVGTKVQVYP